MNIATGQSVTYPTVAGLAAAAHLKFNLKVFRKLRKLTHNAEILKTALKQTPFQIVYASSDSNIISLNRLYQGDLDILNNPSEHKELITLFLTNYFCLFNNPQSTQQNDLVSRSEIQFVLQILKTNHICSLRTELEDMLFEFLEKDTYEKYANLLENSKKALDQKRIEVLDYLNRIMHRNKLEATIQSRLKSLYSIYQKIRNKRIPLEQIIDIIGLRLITDRRIDCYTALQLILENFPTIAPKIKDYIAVPKTNHYESIHVTVLYQNIPLEIQIRTKSMHQNAEYGKSSHYKPHDPQIESIHKKASEKLQ